MVTNEGVEYDRMMQEFKAEVAAIDRAISDAVAAGDYLRGCQLSRQKSSLTAPSKRAARLRACEREQAATPATVEVELPLEEQLPSNLAVESTVPSIQTEILRADERWQIPHGYSTSRRHYSPTQSPLPTRQLWNENSKAVTPSRISAVQDAQNNGIKVTLPTPGSSSTHPRAKFELVEDPSALEDGLPRPRQLLVGQRRLRQIFGARDANKLPIAVGIDLGRYCVAAPPRGVPITTPWGGVTSVVPNTHSYAPLRSAEARSPASAVLSPRRSPLSVRVSSSSTKSSTGLTRPWTAVSY